MDRRVTLKWMLAAATAMPLTGMGIPRLKAGPYGTDPDVQQVNHPGDLWPLTFTATQKKQVAILSDTIVPADAHSPSASAVGIVDFMDEWVSAPYPTQREDRKLVLDGLAWFDAEGMRRFSKPLPELGPEEMRNICDDICYLPKARPELVAAARFFARYRDLTVGGFYTTPQGRADLRYVGNTPMPKFEGPPPEVLRKVGLL